MVSGHRVRRGRARLPESPTLSELRDLGVTVQPLAVGRSPDSRDAFCSCPRWCGHRRKDLRAGLASCCPWCWKLVSVLQAVLPTPHPTHPTPAQSEARDPTSALQGLTAP